MAEYAKVVVDGSPISKSNFKLWNKDGRAILPNSSGKYHDRYANYEDEIALNARIQNPGIVFNESLIAILKVYYKSERRHPDTNNITKSIFDGIEKSGLIINDAQVRRLIIEEYYDKVNPRFELELFAESVFKMKYEIYRNVEVEDQILYDFPSNKKIVFKSNENTEEKDMINYDKTKKNKELKEKNQRESSRKTKYLSNLNSNRISSKNLSNNAIISSRFENSKDLLLEAVERASKNTVSKKTVTCSICGNEIKNNNYKKANNGETIICNKCFKF